MDIGVYCVHPLVKLFGKPKEVYAHGLKLSTGVDGSAVIVAMYEEMQAELLYAKITQSALPSQIQGEEASMIIREIPDTTSIEIVKRDGTSEKIDIRKKENNMYYEVEEFIRLIEEKKSAREHNQYSVWSLEVMDEARQQMGIHFPADD